MNETEAWQEKECRMSRQEILREGERLDDLQTKGYEIIQHPGRFCFGIDAVLLSSFAKVKRGEQAIDLGTGTGIVPILLESKNEGASYTGLEIQKESADMARRSVLYNKLQDKIRIVTGDIKEAADLFGTASFEVVTANPPYMTREHGVRNENEALYIARHEVCCTLDDVLRESSKLLKYKGRLYMVHRPFRLAEIFVKMCAWGIEPKRMRLVCPYINKEPNMVLIEGLRGGKPRITIEPPLVVYEKDGSYTPEVLEMYGEMKGAEPANKIGLNHRTN